MARHLGAVMGSEEIVAAQEAEFEMDAAQQSACTVRSEIPELYFCEDMRGYGWCFRKGKVLNVGFGRLDRHSLSEHVVRFLQFLKTTGKVNFELPSAMLGHAYLIYSKTNRRLIEDGVMLIGDAAGLAYSQSGEGIRPAIESGLLAADVILKAKGDYTDTVPRLSLISERREKAGNRAWIACFATMSRVIHAEPEHRVAPTHFAIKPYLHAARARALRAATPSPVPAAPAFRSRLRCARGTGAAGACGRAPNRGG